MAKAKSPYEAPAPASDKKKALETALQQIEKNFGKGSVMRLGDTPSMNVEAIPTGSLALDLALGIGGVPRGRIIEIYGPESSGKTTLALHILAQAQKRGGEVAFVDAEHALDAVVVDSVAALTPRAEIEGEMGDAFVGLQARLMSQALRKLAGSIAKTNCVVIFINQLRMKIGVLYGNPETTTGGNALKFYSSVRMDVRRIEAIKNGTQLIGNRTRVKVIKNKVAPPFKEAVFDIMYGEGISRYGEMVDLGVQLDLIHKAGSWFSIDGERIGQGRDNARQFLMDNPDLADELEEKIRAQMFHLNGRAAPNAPAAPAASPVEPAGFAAPERPMPQGVSITADDFNDED